MRLAHARRIAIVTPYLGEIQNRILENYSQAGFEIAAERHLEDRGNFSFACYSPERVANLIRETLPAKPDAIAVICTNFRGADLVEEIERETDALIIDTVSVTLWGTLRACGVRTDRIVGWGRLFRDYP